MDNSKDFAKVSQNGNRVLVKYHGKPRSEEDCLSYLNDMTKIYDQKIKFLVLYDASLCVLPEFKYIQMQADFMRRMEPLTRKFMVRAAIYVSGPLSRTVLQALFAVRQPAAPCKVFSDLQEAKKYLDASHLPRLNTVSAPADVESLLKAIANSKNAKKSSRPHSQPASSFSVAPKPNSASAASSPIKSAGSDIDASQLAHFLTGIRGLTK